MKEVVQLDLNAPDFLESFLTLPPRELAQVAKAIHRLRRMTWEQVYASSGLNWEAIRTEAVFGSSRTLHSIRLSQKYRALVTREASSLRFVSLHLDHDSAYE